jgi:phosphopentomutase
MTGRGRVVVMVIDGLGVGEMPDRPDEDAGSNTLAHVLEHSGVRLSTLHRLGIANATTIPGMAPIAAPRGAYGVADLGYPGADSLLGHQEMMGASAAADLRLLADVRQPVIEALQAAGHHVDDIENASTLIVDGAVMIADNVEAQAGLGINVSSSLDFRSFDEILAIGKIVRAAVPVPRVIVAAGRGFGLTDMIANLARRPSGQVGLDTPALGMYDTAFRVRHLGVAVAVRHQAPSLVAATGSPVTLIGKAADVVQCEFAVLHPAVCTDEILSHTLACVTDTSSRGGLVVTNVQETDLAGHEQDPHRFGEVLVRVDRFLPRLLGAMADNDVLIITADHVNDPCIGHSQHTRERVPVIVAGEKIRPRHLGSRTSLADIAATITDLLGARSPRQGVSFASSVV